MDANRTTHLIYAILEFLEQQALCSELNPEAKESLEVASQCLQSAYGISLQDENASAICSLPGSLLEIFTAGLKELEIPQASTADKEKAERLKSEGNEMLKQDKYQSAIDCYTEAIAIDGKNAVYFCNRAAAYGKMGDHHKCLADCHKALELDPNYSKAYGRKGLAHTALEQHKEAQECFQKALELDPVNSGYKENLRLAEQSLNEQRSTSSMPGGGGLNIGGLNLSQMFSNPALMNMATSMLANPQMQAMMTNMMSGASAGSQSPAGTGSISNLLQAGQQMAQEMQASNPELIEQLRAQMRNPNPPSNEHNEQSEAP